MILILSVVVGAVVASDLSTELALMNLRCLTTEGCFKRRYCESVDGTPSWPRPPAAALAVDLSFEKRLFCTESRALKLPHHGPAGRIQPCLVYSFGIHKQWTWEAEMARVYGCEVHAFDPVENYDETPNHLAPGVTFHKLGLQSGTSQDGTNGEGYSPIDPTLLLTLAAIQGRLGHAGRPIAVLMMDCEGCEWGAIHGIVCGGSSSAAAPVIDQIVAEFHFQASLGLDSVASVRAAGETLRCLERDWAMTSWQRAGAGPADWSFAPGVLRAITRPDALVVASFRALAPADHTSDAARETYAQACHARGKVTGITPAQDKARRVWMQGAVVDAATWTNFGADMGALAPPNQVQDGPSSPCSSVVRSLPCPHCGPTRAVMVHSLPCPFGHCSLFVALRAVWLALTLATLVTPLVPVLTPLVAHGRLRLGLASSMKRSKLSFLMRLTVSKRFFLHFYLIGFALLAAAWWALEKRPRTVESLLHLPVNSIRTPLDAVARAALALVAAHLARRAAECACLIEWGTSRMHLAAYFLGIGHYALLTLSLLVDAATSAPDVLYTHRYFKIGLGTFAFVAASAMQHRAARTLARMRRGESSNLTKKMDTGPLEFGRAGAVAAVTVAAEQVYVIPRGGAFELLVSPHLTAEVLIYIALALVASQHFPLLKWTALWVCVNQGVSARTAREWYIERFGNAFPTRTRWTLIPYVW